MQPDGAERMLEAIAQVESGGNSKAIGRAGERSAYQILPTVWKRYTSSLRYADPATGRMVAGKHLEWLYWRYRNRTHLAPSPRDLAIMWQVGWGGYKRAGLNHKKFSREIQDRAQRIINLIEKND